MFVLAWLEGQGGGVGGSLLIPVFLASPLQGVQPRPVGPGAPLCSRVESRVGGDTAPAPPSPQTPLVVRGSIWLEKGTVTKT